MRAWCMTVYVTLELDEASILKPLAVASESAATKIRVEMAKSTYIDGKMIVNSCVT